MSVVESADLESFHAILSSVLARHGAEPVHSVGELQLLRSRFPDRIRLHAAYLGDCMVAAALVFDNGRIAHTQYLANAEEGRATGALDLLLEQLISDVYSRRSYFSFGISTEDDGWQLNEGLVAQKEGFGGRTIVQDFYEIRP